MLSSCVQTIAINSNDRDKTVYPNPLWAGGYLSTKLVSRQYPYYFFQHDTTATNIIDISCIKVGTDHYITTSKIYNGMRINNVADVLSQVKKIDNKWIFKANLTGRDLASNGTVKIAPLVVKNNGYSHVFIPGGLVKLQGHYLWDDTLSIGKKILYFDKKYRMATVEGNVSHENKLCLRQYKPINTTVGAGYILQDHEQIRITAAGKRELISVQLESVDIPRWCETMTIEKIFIPKFYGEMPSVILASVSENTVKSVLHQTETTADALVYESTEKIWITNPRDHFGIYIVDAFGKKLVYDLHDPNSEGKTIAELAVTAVLALSNTVLSREGMMQA